MGNLVGILAQATRGDQVLLGVDAHCYRSEAGSLSALGGLVPRPMPTDSAGMMSLADLEAAIAGAILCKFRNAGQTCVGPDYLFLPEGKVAEFAGHCRDIMARRYTGLDDPAYTSIADEKSFRRLLDWLEDAREKGASVSKLLDFPLPNSSSGENSSTSRSPGTLPARPARSRRGRMSRQKFTPHAA